MIKRKKKICCDCGHPRYIFSHGRCKYCTNKASFLLKDHGSESKESDLTKLKKKAIAAFNSFIRIRDSKNGEFVCISCQVKKSTRLIQAGHYWAATYESLRFDERNVNGQCVYCNIFKEGNFPGYTNGMIRKYGQDVVNELESLRHKETRRTAFDYQQIIILYEAKSKLLEVARPS